MEFFKKRNPLLYIRANAPRWIVLFIDVAFSAGALVCAALFTMYFEMDSVGVMFYIGCGILGIRVISFLISRTYSGIIRFTGMHDMLRIFLTLTIGEAVILLCYWIMLEVFPIFNVSLLFFWVEYSLLLGFMIFSRLIFKALFASNFRREVITKNVIVYGNSEYLALMKGLLQNVFNTKFNIKGFIETDERSVGKYLMGIKVYSLSALDNILESEQIDMVIIASQILNPERKRRLIDACMSHKVLVKETPALEKLIDGTFTFNQLRNINLEDLLERDVINLDCEHIQRQLTSKTILVTGAAGSIGSEIVRQLVYFNSAKIVLVDFAETPLYDIELELVEKFGFKNFNIEIADIRDYDNMDFVFAKYRPDIVYHAAAYKHVPMIEKNPLEGVKTNIFGTKNIADLAVKYDCGRFVMVSTDKAVNPTNVMGCTKRIAEIYVQSLNGVCDTAFITTRFGNVLGSNGSVIPRFAKQIELGGPVTVTHPEITRFFMTIPEACQLVLQAGILGEGGEIFVFDMGESVKIDDLACKMITLAGYEVGRDIKIIYSGLRPGEKLYEEILSDKETVLPTHNKRINKAKVREYDYSDIREQLSRLKSMLTTYDELEVVDKMKQIVPEYKPNNPKFETIDF